jgi:HAD superfamily hydrolase (TIGR01450 family)
MNPTQMKRGWLVDVEGTLVIDKRYEPVPGAVEWVDSVRGRGEPLAVLTNNSTMTPAEMAARLSGLGFGVREAEVVSAQTRMVEILRGEDSPECWVLGAPSLRRTLEDSGLAAFDLATAEPPSGDRPRALVLGWVDNPDSRLFSRAVELLLRPHTIFVTLHRNRIFRNEGRLEPGLGAWAAALEYATGQVAKMAGKPSPRLFRAGARVLGLPHEQVTMVGDDPGADLYPAKVLGMRTVFVLSGKYPDTAVLEEIAPELHPDRVVGSVAELIGEE